MPEGGLHTAPPKAQIKYLIAQASRDPSQGDVQCQRRIGGRPPPINTPPRWSPRASPGSSCVVTLTTETPTKLHQLKPMTGPMVPAGAGGCDFLADPNRRADQSPVFWRSDELASVIVLTAAPTSAATPSVSLADFPSDSVRRDADDGTHVIIRDDGINHQLWLIDLPSGAMPMAALIPLDATAPQRTDAALRFWRFIAHGRPRTPPAPLRKGERLIAALRALDGHLAGASYRAIAEALFDPSRLASEPWKTASLRDTVIRLVRTGIATMRGDYRNLLGPRRPD